MDIRRTVEADPMITLAENSYGKSRVRLAKLKRHPDRHDFREWTIEILLEGDFESCFVEGDNSLTRASRRWRIRAAKNWGGRRRCRR